MEHYAILIGVNYVDNTHYSQQYRLGCASVNVEKMRQMLLDSKGDNHLLIEEFTEGNAKWELVQNYVNKLKESTKDSKCLITIYFSGHGYQLEEEMEINSNQSTQYLYFYDEMVLDIKFQELLKDFENGIKIHWIIDSCYSGNIPDYLIEIPSLYNVPSIRFGIEKSAEETKEQLLAQRKKYIQERVYYFDKYKGKPLLVNNELLTFTAANSDNVAYENGETNPSFFTAAILALANNKSFNGNYFFFFKKLYSSLSKNAKPKIHPSNHIGLNYFRNNTPFKLNFNTNIYNPTVIMGLKTIDLDTPGSNFDRVTGTLKFEEKYKIASEHPGIQSFPSGETTPSFVLPYLEEYDFAMIIPVFKSENGSKDVTIDFDESKLRYRNPDGEINGVVIVYTAAATISIHGGQPTKGDVTNELGGGNS